MVILNQALVAMGRIRTKALVRKGEERKEYQLALRIIEKQAEELTRHLKLEE